MSSLYQQYHNNLSGLLQAINSQKDSIQVDNSLVPNYLRETYQKARVLDRFLAGYFQNISPTPLSEELVSTGVDSILDQFKMEVMEGLRNKKEDFRKSLGGTKSRNFKNIFEYSGSENFYLSNIYTRFVSENLGHKFEQIANLSNRVFIPEQEIGLKLPGIDLIIYHNELIYYVQLKTKKDTLTGSHSPRSINELRIHINSIFAAALNMGSSWTLSTSKAKKCNIKMLAGYEFWSIIDIDYQLILSKLSRVVKELDNDLYLL